MDWRMHRPRRKEWATVFGDPYSCCGHCDPPTACRDCCGTERYNTTAVLDFRPTQNTGKVASEDFRQIRFAPAISKGYVCRKIRPVTVTVYLIVARRCHARPARIWRARMMGWQCYRRTGHPSSCRPRHADRVVGRRWRRDRCGSRWRPVRPPVGDRLSALRGFFPGAPDMVRERLRGT